MTNVDVSLQSPRIQNLRRGAKDLREHPDLIDHDTLVKLVADWIESEATSWVALAAVVDSLNGVRYERTGSDAADIHFGVDEYGNPHGVIDTSIHAARIVAALTDQEDPK